jgi:FdhE protein
MVAAAHGQVALMKQFDVAPKATWTGGLPGVKAPDALILPDPATRFSRTAARLDFLSAGHPMEEWLRFMARLGKAQHAIADAMELIAGPDPAAVQQAVQEGVPPLSPDARRRDPAWRLGLGLLLDEVDGGATPAAARSIIKELRGRGADAVEALADDVLQGGVKPAEAGPALFVAAALQAYFTSTAACLSVTALRLLPQHGLCPCCGFTPVAGVIYARPMQGVRYLHCSLCSTAWNHVRAVCITCGESRGVALKEVGGGSGAVKAETCDDCHTYAKMLYQAQDMKVDPFADDLATLGLDILVAEAGWSRHAPPLLVG